MTTNTPTAEVVIEDPWVVTLQEKISELELIASWASQVQIGRARDYCRLASSTLKDVIERYQEIKGEAAKKG